MRILITGWPGSGKTTLAKKLAQELNLTHYCTDPQRMCDPGVKGIPDHLDWSQGSQYVCDVLLDIPNAIIEGVSIPRALRKWKLNNPDKAPPCNSFIVLKTQFKKLNDGQTRMGLGVDTVLQELESWLASVKEIKRAV